MSVTFRCVLDGVYICDIRDGIGMDKSKRNGYHAIRTPTMCTTMCFAIYVRFGFSNVAAAAGLRV